MSGTEPCVANYIGYFFFASENNLKLASFSYDEVLHRYSTKGNLSFSKNFGQRRSHYIRHFPTPSDIWIQIAFYLKQSKVIYDSLFLINRCKVYANKGTENL